MGGYQGIARTLGRIQLKHNWRGITRDVEEYVSANIAKKKLIKSKNKNAFDTYGYSNETN